MLPGALLRADFIDTNSAGMPSQDDPLKIGGSAGQGGTVQEESGGVKYLADLDPQGRPQFMTQPCILGRTTYAHSLALPSGFIEYAVPTGFTQFVTTVGIASGFRNVRAAAVFTVEGVTHSNATKILYPSNTLKVSQVEKITVPVTDLKSVRLRVRCFGFTNEEIKQTPAWWGDARFVNSAEVAGEKMLPPIGSQIEDLVKQFQPPNAAAEQETTAIAPFELLSGTGEALAPLNATNVASKFRGALVNLEAYRVVVSGDQVRNIEQQGNIQLGSEYDAQTRAELGKLLGAKNLVVGEISDRDRSGYVLTASMIDLKTGIYTFDQQTVLPPSKGVKEPRGRQTTQVQPSGGNHRSSLKDLTDLLKHPFDPRHQPKNVPGSLSSNGPLAAAAPTGKLLPFLREGMPHLADLVKDKIFASPTLSKEKPVLVIGTFTLREAPNDPLASVNAKNTTTDFRVALHATGAVQIVAAGETLDKILVRKNRELGSEYDAATRAEIGKVSGVKYLLVGEIYPEAEKGYTVLVELHNLETGQIHLSKELTLPEKRR